MTIILHTDPLPDIAPDWPGFDVGPTTRCGFNFYVQYKNLNHIRPYFGAFVDAECSPAPDGRRIYTVARWDSLLAIYEHQCQIEDARDERQTEMGARYAGVPQ